jgi:hypothetical protein
VARKIGLELAVVKGPDLHKLVPARRDDDRSFDGRREANARDPLGVGVLLDGVLALTQSVPELDGAVTSSRHDLTVIRAECNRQDIFGMSNESTSALATIDVPKTKGTIPRARKSKLTIRRDDDIADEVVVASEGLASIAVVALFLGKAPYNDGFVSGSSQ